VSAVISDGTRTSTVTLFDEAISYLLGLHCTNLINGDVCTDPQKTPAALQQIKGQTKKFHLKLQKENQTGTTYFTSNCISETDSATVNAPMTPTITGDTGTPSTPPRPQ
jgi:hypothetical protein